MTHFFSWATSLCVPKPRDTLAGRVELERKVNSTRRQYEENVREGEKLLRKKQFTLEAKLALLDSKKTSAETKDEALRDIEELEAECTRITGVVAQYRGLLDNIMSTHTQTVVAEDNIEAVKLQHAMLQETGISRAEVDKAKQLGVESAYLLDQLAGVSVGPVAVHGVEAEARRLGVPRKDFAQPSREDMLARARARVGGQVASSSSQRHAPVSGESPYLPTEPAKEPVYVQL
jgi:hypothetical protein